MAISLKKNEGISLKKLNSDSNLKKIAIGLGWDGLKKEDVKKGFFSKMFGGSNSTPSYAEPSADLDVSCLCFTDNNSLVDTIWFRQLSSNDKAIKHSGDNRTGAGDGDDETIFVDLTNVNPNISKLVFTVNSYSGQSFSSISGITLNLYNMEPKKVNLATYTEQVTGSSTALIVCKIVRDGSDWKIEVLGHLCHGRTINDIKGAVENKI